MKYDIERLRNDADYYGEYGSQFLSNSDIGVLLFRNNIIDRNAVTFVKNFYTKDSHY